MTPPGVIDQPALAASQRERQRIDFAGPPARSKSGAAAPISNGGPDAQGATTSSCRRVPWLDTGRTAGRWAAQTCGRRHCSDSPSSSCTSARCSARQAREHKWPRPLSSFPGFAGPLLGRSAAQRGLPNPSDDSTQKPPRSGVELAEKYLRGPGRNRKFLANSSSNPVVADGGGTHFRGVEAAEVDLAHDVEVHADLELARAYTPSSWSC